MNSGANVAQMDSKPEENSDFFEDYWWAFVGIPLVLYLIGVYFLWKRCCRKWTSSDNPEDTKFHQAMTKYKHEFSKILLPPESVDTGNVLLGKGKFGMVYKATIRTRKQSTTTAGNNLYKSKVAAIKISTPCRNDALKTLEEAKKLYQVKHEHVIELYGIVHSMQQPIVVMECLEGGNLEEYFDKQRKSYSVEYAPSYYDAIRILVQIAKACGYMHSLTPQYLHRDIAPRNIMLTVPNLSVAIAKLTDFGLVQDLNESVYTTLADDLLPIARLAPEVFENRVYGKFSDVWMFGILMHECYSLGAKPHAGQSMDKVAEKVLSRNPAKRYLPTPSGTPKILESLMHRCWSYLPQERPAFSQLVTELNRISSNAEIVTEMGRSIQPMRAVNNLVPAYQHSQPDLIASHDTSTPICTVPPPQHFTPRVIASPFDTNYLRSQSDQLAADLNSTLSLRSSTSGAWSTANGYGIPRSGTTSETAVTIYVPLSDIPSPDSGRDSSFESSSWTDSVQHEYGSPVPRILAPDPPANEGYVNIGFSAV